MATREEAEQAFRQYVGAEIKAGTYALIDGGNGRWLVTRRGGPLAVDSEGRVIIADEIHTPDSSRYWYRDTYEQAMSQGRDPQSLDKEYVRRWLADQDYLGDGPPPPLTDEVRCEAARRYIEAYERITGTDFVPDLEPAEARIRRNLGL